MILIHRLTPFVIGAIALVGFVLASRFPLTSVWLLPVVFILCSILFARLVNIKVRNIESWILIGTPLMLLFSASLVFLFLDADVLRVALGIITAFFLYFYAENLFGFLHLPVFYQPHALQNLTIVLQVLGMFFFVASAHAFLLFVPFIPITALLIFYAPYVFASVSMSLWMGKAPREIIRRYAIGGTLLFVEFFIVLSYLPSTFTTNAAVLAVFYYLFLGLTRVQVQAKLSRLLLRRYLGLGFGMLLLVILSAQWT
ncbi:MAG: hypothetical protein AAB337_03520 [Patescibacteria group bacterium]